MTRNPGFITVGDISIYEEQRRVALDNVPFHKRQETLLSIQIQQYNAGIRSLYCCKTRFGYAIRSGSGLDNNTIIAEFDSIDNAKAWAENKVLLNPKIEILFNTNYF